MYGVEIILVILGIAAFLSGPIALIISIVALNKANRNERQETFKSSPFEPKPPIKVPLPPTLENITLKQPKPVSRIPKQSLSAEAELRHQKFKQAVELIDAHKAQKDKSDSNVTLEQRIGTKWILIAGVITVIFGVAFFLKYAYDNALIGPLGRVIVVAVAGLVSLAVGEITRRRGYGIVAKSVTALGFAILYVAVFSAFRFYELIGPIPAFSIAVTITLAAMLYAVRLDEVVVAILSLIGGFITPVIVSTGENLPEPLFTYTLILGLGAMLCAYYRNWPAVNFVAFTGTFLLYIGWFEKFFRPAKKLADGYPEKFAIAIGALAVFFSVYLVMPILYEIINKVRAKKEDVLLVMANAAITFFYLWTILFDDYRSALALCAVGLCVAHLVMMALVYRRCPEDIDLRLLLLAIGLIFLTIAVPLYFKMNAVAMAWAVEAFVLALIGIRYHSVMNRIAAFIAILLSLGKLLYQLPMHSESFTIIFNSDFMTWMFVAAAIIACHLLYRLTDRKENIEHFWSSQALYSAAMLVVFAAAAMEWYWYCHFSILADDVADIYLIRVMILLPMVLFISLVARPIVPRGPLCPIIAVIVALFASVFTVVIFPRLYQDSFTFIINNDFIIAMLFVAGLFAAAALLKFSKDHKENSKFAILFAITGILVLLILLTEQIYLYWYCKNRYLQPTSNWLFLANMYVSVMWALYGAALMVAGFYRRARIIRYIAMALFAVLLAKVFISDTSQVESVYRIAAFLATGITLVGVSYLYQYLKKTGFFDAILPEQKDAED